MTPIIWYWNTNTTIICWSCIIHQKLCSLFSVIIDRTTKTINRTMQTNYTTDKQMIRKNITVVPTKTDSRSSETQKRLYASPNGAAYKLLTRSIITSDLLETYQGDSLLHSGRTSPTSVLDQQMSNLEDWILSVDQSGSRSVWILMMTQDKPMVKVA